MNAQYNIGQLQEAADYRRMRDTLPTGGIGRIVFGMIGIGLGCSTDTSVCPESFATYEQRQQAAI